MIMKITKLLFATFFILTMALNPLRGQGGLDSLRFSQESGTLQKQRFIDQYDYVFMTKEPTKWIVKMTVQSVHFVGSNYTLLQRKNIGIAPLWLSFERKISPSFSLQLGASYFTRDYVPVSENGIPIARSPFSSSYNPIPTLGDTRIVLGSVEGRWYYNLKKRIDAGKSANNFSGNYFGLRLEKAFNQPLDQNPTVLSYAGQKYNTDYQFEQFKHRISLVYGVQRRFLKHGLIDFGIHLYRNSYQQIRNQVTFLDGNNTVYSYNPGPDFWKNIQSNWSDVGTRNEFAIRTEIRVGLAFGDFKKNPKRPLCDVLRCYDDQKSLFKIAWPSISIGSRLRSVTGNLAYERKIGKSAFSIDTQFDFRLMNESGFSFFFSDLDKAANTTLVATIQPRYYFTQAKRIREHGTGSNLSGFYGGLSISGVVQRRAYKFSKGLDFEINEDRYAYRPVFGYQQKLFSNGFIDTNIGPLWAGSGSNPSGSMFDFKIGFAF